MDNPIQIDPEVMHGTPCFAGTRVPVKSLFELFAHGRSLDHFIQEFPSVRREQAVAVLELAAEYVPYLDPDPISEEHRRILDERLADLAEHPGDSVPFEEAMAGWEKMLGARSAEPKSGF